MTRPAAFIGVGSGLASPEGLDCWLPVRLSKLPLLSGADFVVGGNYPVIEALGDLRGREADDLPQRRDHMLVSGDLNALASAMPSSGIDLPPRLVSHADTYARTAFGSCKLIIWAMLSGPSSAWRALRGGSRRSSGMVPGALCCALTSSPHDLHMSVLP